MKRMVREANYQLKRYFWCWKFKMIPNGLFFPGKNIRHIGRTGRDVYCYPDSQEKNKLEHQTCGIASLKMLTDHLSLTRDSSIYEMTRASLKFKTFFIPEVVKKPEDIKGIFHKGLLKYARSFGLVGFCDGNVSLEKVAHYLHRGWLFVASVNIYQIWGGKWKHISGGKHMVLVTGFRKSGGRITRIYYKDISTNCRWDRETDVVEGDKFEKNFNRRGIFLNLKNQGYAKN